MNRLTLISPETYLNSSWSGGRTTQLCLLPESASYAARNFDLRISSATVEIEESVFSDLRGYSRIIAPLEGSFDLQHPDRKGLQHFHLERYQLHAFDGGEKTLCQGRGRDFNVIFRHGLDVKVMRLDLGEEPLALDLSAAALARAGAAWAESGSAAALAESGSTLDKAEIAEAAIDAAWAAGVALAETGSTGTDLAASGSKKIYLFFPKATSFEVEGEAAEAPALTLWQFDLEQSRKKNKENDQFKGQKTSREQSRMNGRVSDRKNSHDENLLRLESCEKNGEKKMPRSPMLCLKLSAPAYLIMMTACKDE